MAGLSVTALTGAIVVTGIALTAARSGGGSLERPGRADDRTPTSADQRSATRIVFPEPRRVELEEVIVDLREPGPHEVVVQARRGVISPGTELAHYRLELAESRTSMTSTIRPSPGSLTAPGRYAGNRPASAP